MQSPITGKTALLISFLLATLLKLVNSQSYASPSQSLNFTLGPNIIRNPNVSFPVITPKYFTAYSGSVNGWSTKFKYVEIIDACLQQGYGRACRKYIGISCGWQFIDVDSIKKNEQYYQQFSLPGGREFQLQFDWISEIGSSIQSMGLSVIWNGITVFTVFDISCKLKTSTLYLETINGTNQIAFHGMGTADSAGIMIRNVMLNQINYIQPQAAPVNFWNLKTVITHQQFYNVFTVFDSLKNTPPISWAERFPGLKQCSRFFFGLALEFNHLLLYNYHRANFTRMAAVILAGVQALDDQKGFLLDSYIYPSIGTSPESIATLKQQGSLPVSMNREVTAYMQRPNGMRLLLADTVFLDLPTAIALFGLGCLLFRLLSRCRVSLLLRPCSILGCFLVALLAGKVETLTFHFLSEALLLVSAHLTQKLQTTALIFAYFGVFVFAIASMLLHRASYGKRLKYVFDYCRYPSASSFFMTAAFGLFDVLLGFAHRLLLGAPSLQLCVLMALEAGCLALLLAFLFRGRFASTALGTTLCAMSCARLAFVGTLFAAHIGPAAYTSVSSVQQCLFYALIGLWAISMLIGISQKLCLVFQIIRHLWQDRNKQKSILQEYDLNLGSSEASKPSQMMKSTQECIISSKHELMRKGASQNERKGSKSGKLISAGRLKEKSVRATNKFHP